MKGAHLGNDGAALVADGEDEGRVARGALGRLPGRLVDAKVKLGRSGVCLELAELVLEVARVSRRERRADVDHLLRDVAVNLFNGNMFSKRSYRMARRRTSQVGPRSHLS